MCTRVLPDMYTLIPQPVHMLQLLNVQQQIIAVSCTLIKTH